MTGMLRGQNKEADTYIRLYLECAGMALLQQGRLLMVGMPESFPYSQVSKIHLCGDVCLFIPEGRVHDWKERSACRVPLYASGERLPFKDKAFKYAICTHIIEHLSALQQALVISRELVRVAEEVAYLVPTQFSNVLDLVAHPLSIRLRGDNLEAVDRRTGEVARLGSCHANNTSQGTG